MSESGNNNSNQQEPQIQPPPGAITSQKRKLSCNDADPGIIDDPKTREKRFREEINARQAMPPPVRMSQHSRRKVVESSLQAHSHTSESLIGI